MLDSLRRYRNYRLYFVGQIISYSGTFVQDTALPWLVLQRTHSPFDVGLLVFCRYGPFMVGGLYGGVIADRFDNRRVLMATQGWNMLIACALAAVAFTGTGGLWLIYLLALGTGLALVFDNPSRHALIYQLVGREHLQNAISLNISLQNSAKIVGPAIGGVLIATVGSAWCFAVNAASFLAVLTALVLMRPSELVPVERGIRQGGLRAMREGLAYARDSQFLRVVLGIGLMLGLFGFSAMRTLLSVLADATLHRGPQTFGALFAAYGAGAVAGALANAARPGTSRRRLFAGALLFAVPILALAPVHAVVPAIGLLFLVGAGWSTWSSQALAQVQMEAPDRLRGRVISLYTYSILAATPIGGLLGGWLADVGGTGLAFAVCGSAGLAATAVGVLALRRRRAGPVEDPASEEPDYGSVTNGARNARADGVSSR